MERNVRSRYDYVVVVDGSSGAALVARLSEHSALKVLLEAGRFLAISLTMDGADRCRSSARRFDPLRKVIVYLAPLRSVAAHWNAPFGQDKTG